MLPRKVNHFIDKLRLKRMEKQLVSHPYDWEGYRQVLEEFVPRNLPKKIYLNQIWEEWRQLMNFFVPERNPKRILEIGTGRAGSSYFLTKVGGAGSTVVTIDAQPLAAEYVDLYQRYPNQRIYGLTGMSHDPAIISRAETIFGKEPLDLLFIDGDHSYEGVRKDFELYKKFCNEKTIICFHDIIADHGVTKGIQTDSNSGEVYKFWSELKSAYEFIEFVQAFDQDGFGIGVLVPQSQFARGASAS
jgi:predicted O-methyltransferase YrrM